MVLVGERHRHEPDAAGWQLERKRPEQRRTWPRPIPRGRAAARTFSLRPCTTRSSERVNLRESASAPAPPAPRELGRPWPRRQVRGGLAAPLLEGPGVASPHTLSLQGGWSKLRRRCIFLQQLLGPQACRPRRGI